MAARVWLGIGAILVAYLYTIYFPKNGTKWQEMREVIGAWENIISAPDKQFQRVALGVNSNVDLIVRACSLLETLEVAPGASQDHPVLNNLRELQETFHHFFSRGAAVERFYGDTVSFRHVVDVAATLAQQEWSVGGNAALMAQKMAMDFPHIQVQLVGPVGPKLLELLPSGVQVPNYSHTEHDEVHLIMEYSVGEKWGDAVTPVATRLITSNDKANSDMSHLEAFFSGLASYQPDLTVLSGLHLLDGHPGWQAKLDALLAGLDRVPPSSPLHLELASMADKTIMKEIINKVLHRVDSIGLNEQELAFLSLVGGGPHPDLNHHGAPDLHKVIDILAWLLETFGPSAAHPDSHHLSRVHFHSLTLHVIGTVATRWSNQRAAVAASARVAGQQACDMQHLQPDFFKIPFPQTFKAPIDDSYVTQSFNASNPVLHFTLRNLHFDFSPVLVCLEPSKTVGLGDAISSTALLYSQFLGKS